MLLNNEAIAIFFFSGEKRRRITPTIFRQIGVNSKFNIQPPFCGLEDKKRKHQN
jgi:hypothetical protein